MTTIGNGVVAPGSPTERQGALLKAFRSVDDFRKVEEFYNGKKLPEDEFFENTLVREFHIARERVQSFMQVFTKNLTFLRAFRADNDIASPIDEPDKESGSLLQSKLVSSESQIKTRTFLDTCFVMMPFGLWPRCLLQGDICPGHQRGWDGAFACG
jgi:hypothetical protein